MTNIFSSNQSYYTTAECFVAGNLFRKTLQIGGRGTPCLCMGTFSLSSQRGWPVRGKTK